MSEEDKVKDEEGDDVVGVSDEPAAETLDSPDDDDAPRITLDRYLSRRRAPPRSGIPHLIAAVVMLVTLVMIIMYKDRCGRVVSGVMGDLDTPTQQGRPARIEIKQPEKK